MFNEKFDFVFSIGEDCACAMYLNQSHLRSTSSPFDWLCHATFQKRIELLCNNFDGFLIKENMKWFAKPLTGLRDLENDNYEDTATGFYFYHDFKENVPLDTTFEAVKQKYDRRIDRLYKNINKYNKILCVWWSSDKKIDDREIISAQKLISQKFNKSIYFLIFENDTDLKNPQENILSPYIIKYKANLVGEFAKTTQGDTKISMKIFNQIKYQKKYQTYFKKKFAKFITFFIPIKKWRKVIRKHIVAY